jgi:biotin-dependent carboxylase-like uncharacterized protein
VLEITFVGPKLQVVSDALVAITGAEAPVRVNQEPRPLWESFMVRPGDILSVRAARKGLRVYLAVGGGIEVPEIMGSRSTYPGGKLGGVSGRALMVGDVLFSGDHEPREYGSRIPDAMRLTLGHEITLRAVAGPQDNFFDEGLDIFLESLYTVSVQADRMGYRLEGPVISFKSGRPTSIISEASLPGGVQVPPDGQPIIVLVEQTVGGYAKIATVITPDLDRVAQARPGDRVQFVRVDLAQAHRLYAEYHARLDHIRSILCS